MPRNNDLFRIIRTVRYLSVSQVFGRILCRSKFLFAEQAPRFYSSWIEKTASGLSFEQSQIKMVNQSLIPIVNLLNYYDSNDVEGIARGEFYFLGREVNFGALDKIDWDIDLDERNNPLWRMSLSYFGFVLTVAKDGDDKALFLVSNVLREFRLRNFCHKSGNSRGLWHPYSSSHRVINILAAICVLNEREEIRSPHRDEVLEELVLVLKENVVYTIANIEYDLQFNHLLKNLVAIWFARLFISNLPISDAWLIGLTRFALHQNFLYDGAHAERSPMYHNLAMLDLKVLEKCVSDANLLDDIASLMSKTVEVASALTHSHGELALFKDGWISGAPSLQVIAGELTLTISAMPARVHLPAASYIRFSDVHHSIIWDYGEAGPSQNLGHAHSDFLSYELASHDRKMITDFGTPTYSKGELRAECRSAKSHNGPRVGGREPMECWDSFKVGQRPNLKMFESRVDYKNDIFIESAAHDGFREQRVTVARTLVFKPNEALVVIDFWLGNTCDIDLYEVSLLIPAREEEVRHIGVGESLGPVDQNPNFYQGFVHVVESSHVLTQEALYYPDFHLKSPATKITIKPVSHGRHLHTSVHCVSLTSDGSTDQYSVYVKSFENIIAQEKSNMLQRLSKMKPGYLA